MNKEYYPYVPEEKEIEENNKYFNKNTQSGGKRKKEKEIDRLMSSKFKKDYFNENTQR